MAAGTAAAQSLGARGRPRACFAVNGIVLLEWLALCDGDEILSMDDTITGVQWVAFALLVAFAVFGTSNDGDAMDEQIATTECFPSDRDAALADHAWKTLQALIDPLCVEHSPAGQAAHSARWRTATAWRDALHAEDDAAGRRAVAGLADASVKRIACRKVGAHRRVRAEDVLAYRRETESRRRDALDELTARDQELGLQ